MAAERLARGTQSSPPPATTSPPEENTGRNVRDESGATVTPEDQPETKADRKLAASIRRSVVKDKSLSLDAHNAKIVVRGGNVTLRGPVETSAEKDKLQAIAQKTRGVKQIDNELEPKTP
jgi:osmotically-inducible protein OsmY